MRQTTQDDLEAVVEAARATKADAEEAAALGRQAVTTEARRKQDMSVSDGVTLFNDDDDAWKPEPCMA